MSTKSHNGRRSMTMTTNEDLDRLRLAAEGAVGGPPSAEQEAA